MRLQVLGVLLFAVFGVEVAAAGSQVRKYPYPAVVVADEADVFSGPGRKYYPTSTLGRGSRVTVHRHDPGGWYMIAPPEGSFSFVRAEYVKQESANRGVLTANDVVVRVGSSLDHPPDVEQRRLSTGAEVEIIEKTTLQTERGPVAMFKIKPPPGEYRWIAGRSVVPANEVVRHQHDRDPFAVPSGVRRSQDRLKPARRRSSVGQTFQSASSLESLAHSNGAKSPKPANAGKSGIVQRPLLRTADLGVHTASTADDFQNQRNRLKQLDAQFRAILRADTARWDFTQLEQDYRQLQQDVSHPGLARRLDMRFASLSRYQKLKAEYDDFIRLTAQTSQREAQLLSLQRQDQSVQPPSATPEIAQPEVVPGQPSISEGQPIPQPQPIPQTQPQPKIQRQPISQGPPVPPAAGPRPQSRTQPVPPFDGAGIIQRAATTFPGAPRHVLLTPRGRILAYLQAEPGINLDPHVGQSMGIFGKRWFRRDLQSDFIVVRKMAPVRLRP